MLKLLRFACILFFASSAYATANSLDITYVEPDTEIRNLIWEKRPSASILKFTFRSKFETTDQNVCLRSKCTFKQGCASICRSYAGANSNLRKRF